MQGLALVDRESKPEIIRFFPVGDLPEEPEERFVLQFCWSYAVGAGFD